MSDKHKTIPNFKRNIMGGVVGNILEWYDFAVFGFFAPIIATQFFPSDNALVSLIQVFGVFAAGYIMRPLGGALFGHIGDRIGRKEALRLSVLMMAIPTTLLGFLPTHAQVGLLAPILLVVLRLVQGLSVGGELVGSITFITEIAPKNRRGLFGSLAVCGANVGILLGCTVATVIHGVFDPEFLQTWGWRIPFLLGFVIGGVGLWMRSGMHESPEFEHIKHSGEIGRSPVVEAVRTMPGRIFHLAAILLIFAVGVYTLFVWWPTYLTQIIQPPVPHALMVNAIAMTVFIILIFFAGWLSDIVGRKKVHIVGMVGMVIVSYPLFMWTDHGDFASALMAQLIFAVFLGAIFGPMAATMTEMFPTRLRFSSLGIGYNVTFALFGGTAPLVCTWVIKSTGDIASPAYYLIAAAVVSLVSMAFYTKAKDV